MRKAGNKDLNSINKIIELCQSNRPVSDRIKKLTLSSLLFKPTDLDFMAIWVVGEPITGVLGLQKINEGMLLHSIYVNPSQFNDANDFEKYPKNEANDLELLRNAVCDAVFIPSKHEIENLKKNEPIDFGGLDKIMESRFRSGHFIGVVEIVSRLFTVVTPDKAFFGEKDFQQLQIIRRMVDQLHFPIEIIGGPIIREANGLAMSSRNERLSKKARNMAGFIYEILIHFSEPRRRFFENQLLELGFELEYLEKHDFGGEKRLFIAGFYDHVRLIDNIKTN